jgi:hypothetical protein
MTSPLFSCSQCHKDFESRKFLKRVNDLWFCEPCYSKKRKERRAETIQTSGIANELRELKNIQNRSYSRQRYAQLHPKVHHEPLECESPLIKNSSVVKPHFKSNCFLTYQEKKVLPKILKCNNIYQRIGMIQRQQEEVRKKLKEENKVEAENVVNKRVEKDKLLEGLK